MSSEPTPPKHSAGRVRRGLEAEVRQTRPHRALSTSGLAILRSLADQIDQLERALRHPDTRPYDRVPLTVLVKQFDDTYQRVFVIEEPIDDAYAELIRLASTPSQDWPTR